ncbi:hypothetical protein EZS27_023176 [termite gut metagenome]|uniref:Uncharacterized protein n=1 Tax=termite gut metagenome TaxID=433724 RepID=A0A5J4R2E4_9ZZZZ
MIYTVIYSQDAKETLAKFKKSNPGAFKKVMKFINELHGQVRDTLNHL